MKSFLFGLVCVLFSSFACSDGINYSLSDGTHPGPIVVKAGATLKSSNPHGATVEAKTGAAIIVETEEGVITTVTGVNVRALNGTGILVKGNGTFVGDNLDVYCEKGIGIAAEGVSSFILENTKINGSITPEKVPELYFPKEGISAGEAPISGVILSGIKSIGIKNMSIIGFAGFGAIFFNSSGEWNDGTISKNVGVGLIQSGGSITLNNVFIEGNMSGVSGPGIIATYGMVVSDKSTLKTQGLSVKDNEGYGVIQDNSSSSHVDINVSGNNKGMGYILQNSTGDENSPALAISGNNSLMNGNLGAGIAAINSGYISLSDVKVSNTITTDIISGLTTGTIGAGLQFSKLTGNLRASNVSLTDNQKTGTLFSEAPAANTKIEFNNVNIDGSGEYGLITNPDFPADDYPSLKRNAGVFKTDQLDSKDSSFKGTMFVLPAFNSVISVGGIRNNGLIGGHGLIKSDGQVNSWGKVNSQGLIGENG